MAAIEVQITASPTIEITHERLEVATPDPVQVQINGVNLVAVPSGDTHDQQIHNTAGTDIGTVANPSVVADSTVTINGSSLGATGSVVAEGTLDITVNLDGIASGSWDGDSWELVSAACADATVNINGVFMDNIASGATENIEVRQELGTTTVGSKQGQFWRIQDSTVQNNASSPTWTNDVAAEETLTLDQGKALDSDGTTDLLADYLPNGSGYMFTCTPADYGTRILSRFRREFCIPVTLGFSFDEIDDEFVGEDVVRVIRTGDSAIETFTKAELLAGDHVTWVVAGGGTEHGYAVGMRDQSRQGFYLYNTNTAYMPYIVKSGVAVVDSQGLPCLELRSTQGMILGSEAHNTGYMPFWNTNATCWAVQKLASGASQAWLLTISGNPAFARVGSGSFPNSINCGSPITKVNDTVLADQNWDTLMTATEGIEAIVNTIDIDFSQRTQWSQNAAVKVMLNYPVGSTLSEFVVTFGDATAQQDYIFDDRNNYYNRY